MSTPFDVRRAAADLAQAEKNRRQIDPLVETFPDMTVEDAYAVQLENVRLRREAGEKVVGMKIGLTSNAMQKVLGVNEPDYGHLFEPMLVGEGRPCSTDGLIDPKVEGELAFRLGKALGGPGVTMADVYAATEYVIPAIEILDTRIRDWKITLPDTVADNGSAARFVLGGRMRPVDAVDMRLTGMTLEKNGDLLSSGALAEVWGNPAAAVAWLANKLGGFGVELPEGCIVLAGAVTAMAPVAPGDNVTVSFQGMGSVSALFTKE